MLLKKLIPVFVLATGGLALHGCGLKPAEEAAPAANSATTSAAPAATPAAVGYTAADFGLMRKAVERFQTYVRNQRLDPKGKEYKKEAVARNTDLADTYLKNLIAANDQYYGRMFPADKVEEQGRWIFEKECMMAGLNMLGPEGKDLHAKVMKQYMAVVDPLKGDKAKTDAIQKGWRFPIRWGM